MRELKLKPSRSLGLGFALLAILVCVAIMRADLPAWVQAGLMAGVGITTLWGVRRTARLPSLALAGDGGLHGRHGNEDWQVVTVLPDSFVSTILIVLRYREQHGRVRSVSLLPDSATADDLRRLRVSLRWARHTRSDTSSPDVG